MASILLRKDLYLACRKVLSPQGVSVYNLSKRLEFPYEIAMKGLQGAFDAQVLMATRSDSNNVIAYGLNQSLGTVDKKILKERIRKLSETLKLDFSEHLKSLYQEERSFWRHWFG